MQAKPKYKDQDNSISYLRYTLKEIYNQTMVKGEYKAFDSYILDNKMVSLEEDIRDKSISILFLTQFNYQVETQYLAHFHSMYELVKKYTDFSIDSGYLQYIFPKILTLEEFNKNKNADILTEKKKNLELLTQNTREVQKLRFCLIVWDFYVILNDLGDWFSSEKKFKNMPVRKHRVNEFILKCITHMDYYIFEMANFEGSAIMVVLENIFEEDRYYTNCSLGLQNDLFSSYHFDYNDTLRKFMEQPKDTLIQEVKNRKVICEKSTLPFSKKNDKNNIGYERIKKLYDNVKKLQLENIGSKTDKCIRKSRSILLCIHGWLQEKDEKSKTWGDIADLFPMTEVIAVSWESSSDQQLLASYLKDEFNTHMDTGDKGTTKIEPPKEQKKESKGWGGLFSSIANNAQKVGSSILKDQIQKQKDKPHDSAQYKKNLALGALFMAEKVVSVANYGLEEFKQGMEKACLSGEYQALVLATTKLLNGNNQNIQGFSLGTYFTYNLLNSQYCFGVRDIVGDVFQAAAAFGTDLFYENLYRLIGKDGVIQGKLYIFYCKNDSVLRSQFSIAKDGSEVALGIGNIDRNRLVENLQKNDPNFEFMPYADTMSYIDSKLELVDCTNIVKGHGDYGYKWYECFKKSSYSSEKKCFI